MRATTTKQKFLNAVLLAERVVDKKDSLPVLSCALINVGKNIVVRATNLEAGVEVGVPCDVSEKGGVAVPAGILAQTVRSVMSEKLTLALEDGNLVVESRGSRTLVKAVPHDEFPELPKSAEGGGVRVSRGGLLRGIQSVSYAASPSMIRPELGSIYIMLADDKLTTVATDSFRLAEKVLTMRGGGRAELLLPLRHAQELVHVFERVEIEDVHISGDESQLTVTAEGVRFVSRVVEGTFPNYKEILPKNFSAEVTLLKSDLSEVLKKARVFSGGEQHVGFHVYPKKKLFTATARSADVGEMSDSLDAALSGDDLDINFHIGYIADCLPIIEADSITLGFSGSGKPLVIRGVSDPTFTYLVMPLNR